MVRRLVVQRWVLVVTTWLRAVRMSLLVVLSRWQVVRSVEVRRRFLAARGVHLPLVSRSLQIATWYQCLEGTSKAPVYSSSQGTLTFDYVFDERRSLYRPWWPTERSQLQPVRKPLQGRKVRNVEGYRAVWNFLGRQHSATFSCLDSIRTPPCMPLWSSTAVVTLTS